MSGLDLCVTKDESPVLILRSRNLFASKIPPVIVVSGGPREVQPAVPPGPGPAGPGDGRGEAGRLQGRHRRLPGHPAGRGGGETPDVLQVQQHLSVQGGGHDQPGRPQGLETHVQSPHHESSGCQEWKNFLKIVPVNC